MTIEADDLPFGSAAIAWRSLAVVCDWGPFKTGQMFAKADLWEVCLISPEGPPSGMACEMIFNFMVY